jgi:hypothetical protein
VSSVNNNSLPGPEAYNTRMLQGVHPIFIVPWFVVLALVIGLGVRRGMRDGVAKGFKTAALTVVLGLVVLAIFFVAVVVIYYANGGH